MKFYNTTKKIDITLQSTMQHLTPSGVYVFPDVTKIGKWTVYVTDTDPDLKMFEFKQRGVYLTWKDNKLQVTGNFSDCNNVFNTKGNKLLHDQSQKYIYCNGGRHSCDDGIDAKNIFIQKNILMNY